MKGLAKMILKNFKIRYLFIFCTLTLSVVFGSYDLVFCDSAFENRLARDFSKQEQENIKNAMQVCLYFRNYVENLFENAIKNGELKKWQVFDRFYIPVPIEYYKKVLGKKFNEKYYNFPPQFNTEYTKFLEKKLLPMQKKLVKKHGLIYLVISDYNGYVPTHNASKALTGVLVKDIKQHRSKRMFSDVIGLKSSRNVKQKILLQDYVRDTGERFADMSTPIFVLGKHWGGVRLGFKITVN